MEAATDMTTLIVKWLEDQISKLKEDMILKDHFDKHLSELKWDMTSITHNANMQWISYYSANKYTGQADNGIEDALSPLSHLNALIQE